MRLPPPAAVLAGAPRRLTGHRCRRRCLLHGRDLLRAGPTRFASNFICLESLIKYRHQLGQLINSKQFLQHVNTLRPDSKDVALEVQDMISNAQFCEKISYYLKVIEPLVLILRMVDGDDKNDMGYVYKAMDKAKENLRERNPKAYRKWWAIIDKRWEMTLHHDLHTAGCFFNPTIQYKDNVHNDGEVMRGTMTVITRLERTMNERLDAMAEVERYRMKLGIYGGYNMRCAAQRLTLGLQEPAVAEQILLLDPSLAELYCLQAELLPLDAAAAAAPQREQGEPEN
ncbi:hypothetical protein Taro_045409 [Colocasia esculenta]|uniref:Uncharacterized protein n=1 Tax=Colocasia esculenta TaxID=4460 RepID=A0A843WR78_COLES|nr:hypothetical protein [Colocasia esculenta]